MPDQTITTSQKDDLKHIFDTICTTSANGEESIITAKEMFWVLRAQGLETG